ELEYYSRALMTDVARTRTDLEDSQRRLLLAEKLAAGGRFAPNPAHEIRNPLTSMNMWLYQLRQTAEHSPASAHACDVLESELGRLMQLTNSFLQLSRSPELKLAAVDAGAVIDST